jgi:hypothetical protein
MNSYVTNGVTKRVLVLMLAAGTAAFSACGTETRSAQVAPSAAETRDWEGSLYPRPFEPRAERPHDGESLRAPRAMGGDPTVPTGSQPPGSVV